jgi:alpha-tubulin suppressor-like RCC1 family protein
VPDPNQDFVAIAAGAYHSLGLKNTGEIVAWGNNGNHQTEVPPNTQFSAVSSGLYFSVGRRTDGSIVVWGANLDGVFNVPSPNRDFLAVAGGAYHCLAIRQ